MTDDSAREARNEMIAEAADNAGMPAEFVQALRDNGAAEIVMVHGLGRLFVKVAEIQAEMLKAQIPAELVDYLKGHGTSWGRMGIEPTGRYYLEVMPHLEAGKLTVSIREFPHNSAVWSLELGR